MIKVPEKFKTEAWLIELAIRDKKRPDTDELIRILKNGWATPIILDYIALINDNIPLPPGRPPKTADEAAELLNIAQEQIHSELLKAKKAGEKAPSLTEAIKRASRRECGLGISLLKEMARLHKDLHDGRPIA